MRLLFLFITLHLHYCAAMQPINDSDLVKNLFEAIENGKTSIVESVIKDHSYLVQNYSEKENFSDQVSALHVAVACGNDPCTKLLLVHKADPNNVTKYKLNTPLHYVQTLKGACLLLKAGARVDQENARGRTPLWNVFIIANQIYQHVIKTDSVIVSIAQFLLANGADINKKDKNLDTLLHYAMRHKHVHAVDFLLNNYADQDQPDGLGITPLDMLIKSQQSNGIMQVFAKQGIFFFPKISPIQLFTTNLESLNNWASLFSYINKKRDSPDYFGSNILPTRGGIMCNQYGCLARNVSYKDLQQFFGSDSIGIIQKNLDAQCKEVISLVRNGDHAALKQKIKRFPFVTDYRDVFTLFMLKEAIEPNNGTKSLEILLNNRIAPKIINMQILNWGPKLYTQQGTFLHVAVFCNNAPAIRELMNHKADCLMVDKQKDTPMMYAQKMNRQDCIKELNRLIMEQFLSAFNKGDFEKSDQLLGQIVDCNAMMDGGNLFLHNLLHCLNSHTKEYINILVNKGAHPDGLNEDGETPLWHLMKFNKDATDIFEELLRVGGRVDRPSSKTHYSLLGIAVHFKKTKLVKLFVQYGALITKKMVEESVGETKLLLQQAFMQQKCFVCGEHKDNLSDVLCKHRHAHTFICIACYNTNHSGNNACPFCSERLN